MWLASRAFLCVVFWLALTFGTIREADGLWRAFPDNPWLDGWLRWDTSWYASVADHGYVEPARIVEGQPRNTAFFPLFPVTMRALSLWTGDAMVAGLIVSNVALLIGMLLFHRLARERLGDADARRASILLAFHPFAFFFSSAYTEALFLALALAAFHFGERERWLPAGVFAALAGLTRVLGFMTAVAVAVLYLERLRSRDRAPDRSAAFVLLGFAGPLFHLGWLAARYGTPFEFLRAQYVEGWARLARFVPRDPNEWQHWLCLVGTIVLCLAARRPLGRAYALWGAGIGVLSLTKWTSGGRLVLVLFPAVLALVRVLRRPVLFWGVATLFAALSAYNGWRFALWYWVA